MFLFHNLFVVRSVTLGSGEGDVSVIFPIESQKKQLEENSESAHEESISENAETSTEEPVEGGPDIDADGEEMTDGIEEDYDEVGSNEMV